MSLHTLADGVFVALLQHILSRILRRLMRAPSERLLNPIANGSWRCLDGAHDFDVRVLEYVDRFFIQDADIWCNCRNEEGGESRKWLISRICEILCWCLTVDVEKHSLAHSWRDVVFRNAEIRSQVSPINTRKVHQLAFKRIALLDPSISLGDYRAAVVSPPRYPYEAGKAKENDRFDLRAPDERQGELTWMRIAAGDTE